MLKNKKNVVSFRGSTACGPCESEQSATMRLDNLFQGRVPSQMDHIKQNPFNLQKYSLNYLNINVNGKTMPRERPLEPDFTNKLFIAEYALMFGSKCGYKLWKLYFKRRLFRWYTLYVASIDPGNQSTLIALIKHVEMLK